MYFQVCSNSTYPQHSGERYRTNGPLIINAMSISMLLSVNRSGLDTISMSGCGFYQPF